MSENGRVQVCALVPYPLDAVPSQRFRIEQWQPFLEKDGIQVEIQPFLDKAELELLYGPAGWPAKARILGAATARRLASVFTVDRFDAVLVHRAACLAGPAMIERFIACRKAMIFDFDDAIYQLDTSAANRRFAWLKFPGKTAALCRLSRHVVAGNDHLARYARQYNEHVTVVPTSIDTERYRPRRSERVAARPLIIGWTGSYTTLAHLEAFAPILQRVVATHDVEIRVVCNREPILPGLPLSWRRWSAEQEVEDLAEFDIGIMPLPDDEWASGKCSLKALQCMAMGTPVVCSPVGANVQLIQHGKNGLLASTPTDWERGLALLIGDPSLRQRLGDAGRATIERRFSMRGSARSLAQVLHATVAAGRSGEAA
jgi:glycosyltransferase involved in cell wall biosynthesis